MKTTVVPAEITSVEDKIAGSFTFTQVIILIVALLAGTTIYVLFPPRLGFSSIKAAFVVLDLIVLGTLAIRWNGKIIAHWLIIYSQFARRPRLYVFTKNDLTARHIPVVLAEKKKVHKQTHAKVVLADSLLTFAEEMQINKLTKDPSLSVSFGLSKKGGINVLLAPTEE